MRKRKNAGLPQGNTTMWRSSRWTFALGAASGVRYRFKEGTPFKGVVVVNESRFQDIVPNRRVVVASSMTMGGNRISASLVTVELLATEGGTDLICTHQGAFFEGADGPERREAGWRKLFDRLAKEMEG